MAGDTKERILETALELFAQNGYLGTSMNDIAQQLGFTKAALYKHYTSKQEILDRIVEHMNEMDYERAESYEMPETEPDGFAEAYLNTPIQKIRAYSMAQFDHWTKEPFSSNFRKMLTLEQYRDPKLAQLHHDYLAGGPLEYMAAIFRKLTDTDEAAMQLALEFYGPVKQALRKKLAPVIAKKAKELLEHEYKIVLHDCEEMLEKSVGRDFADDQFNRIVEFMSGVRPDSCPPEELNAPGKVKCMVLIYEGTAAVAKGGFSVKKSS